MKKNMGTADQIIRLVVALVVLVLYFTSVISGLVATVLLVISGIFIATSIFGFCPLYAIFGLKTCPADKA
ncbi:MAG: DUF2892 domain-containing protein [Cyclobacteriaceae bacterium]